MIHKKGLLSVGVKLSLVVFSVCLLVLFPGRVSLADNDLFKMEIEDLLNIQVTSVSKQEKNLSDSPAAIFVITQDDIRRSGVTSIPEALRMAPGINVARIDSNKWAITSRGFNGRFANKLLVLIDGRTVYSPTFSGVYWDTQDYLLEDVERIEVIRGPGATIWGANAVNGVVNVITKKAEDTQGVLLTAGAGSEEKGFIGSRYGAELGENSSGRVYVKAFERDEYVYTMGSDAGDDWGMLQGGFRVDSDISGNNELTVQGDLYRGEINQRVDLATLSPPYGQIVDDSADVSGSNLLGRWRHVVSSSSCFVLQSYIDWYDRDEAMLNQSNMTFDLDFQHHLNLGAHDLIWGLAYRHIKNEISGAIILGSGPTKRSNDLYSLFVQDEIGLVDDRLWLTIGSKLENNEYTGNELQPSLRLLWAPKKDHTLWASLSKAVRTPSISENDIDALTKVIPPPIPGALPVAVIKARSPNFDSEELVAWEFGYRTMPAQNLSFDLALFYNDYDRLRNNKFGALELKDGVLSRSITFHNGIAGQTYGLELSALWQPIDVWQLHLAYSFLQSEFDLEKPLDELTNAEGPRHQFSVRSITNLREDLDFDVWVRYVDDVKATNSTTMSLMDIYGYFILDVRLAWRPQENLELSLVGQNLLDSQHLEFIQERFTFPTEVERGIYGKITWSF